MPPILVNGKDKPAAGALTGAEIANVHQTTWKTITLTVLKDWLAGFFAATLEADDNYVTDAEKAALHVAATAGAGISVTGQEIANSDTGSAAVTTHNGLYNHSLIHASGSDDQDLSGYAVLHGFVNRTDSTLAFDNSTHVFTLGGTAYQVFINSVSHTFNAPLTIDLDTKTLSVGQWFIWLKADFTLDASKTMWDILDTSIIPVVTLHWDGTSGWIGDERHGAKRNLIEHNRVHTTQGASYVSGFTPTPTFGVAGATANDFTFAGGVICDEDIIHTLTTPQTQCSIGYRAAGGASMVFGAAGGAYAVLNAGVPRWDNGGTLTDITLNNYGVYWIFATNRTATPVVSVMGQGDYASVAAAQAAAMPTLAGMSVAEWKLLYRVIVRRTTPAPFARIQVDIMYNLSNGPAIQAGAPSTVSAGNVTYSPSGNVQTELEGRALIAGGVINGQKDTRTDSTATNGGTSTLDYSLGNAFKIDASALAAGNSFTIALSNVPAGAVFASLEVALVIGANIPTISYTNKGANVTAPGLTASRTNVIIISSWDNGTTLMLNSSGNY